jgi:toxin ParE1/3/4
MAEYRLSEEAEAELDGIWLYIAQDSGSIERATQLIESITDRFWLLARQPYAGRSRDHDLRPGLRSLPADNYVIIHRIEADGVVLILRIFDGRRDIPALMGESGG